VQEVDLIALQTTPEQFQKAEFDVGTFELSNIGAQCTPASIAELRDLRERQLHVRPPHVSRWLFAAVSRDLGSPNVTRTAIARRSKPQADSRALCRYKCSSWCTM
jgi:hypothetical protein